MRGMSIEEQDLRSIPQSKWTKQINSIRETMSKKIYTTKINRDQLIEVSGLVTLSDLPFRWRAWNPFATNPRKYPFFWDNKNYPYKSAWTAHAPYQPSEETKKVTPAEMKYVLDHLKIPKPEIIEAIKGKYLPNFYLKTLADWEEQYQQFYNSYFENPFLRTSYSAAVAMFCDRIETEMKKQFFQRARE
jgi:hypothetical protein